MKKIVIVLLGVFLLASCSKAPQERAEQSVKEFIENGDKTYKPGEFGKLDTISLDTDKEYRTSKDSLFFYKKKLTEKADQFHLAAYQNGAGRMKDRIKYLESFYGVVRYRINHTYHLGNEQKSDYFYLNRDLVVEDIKY